jgi:hypothetical protein
MVCLPQTFSEVLAFEHFHSQVYTMRIPHKSAHNLLLALFCFPLCICVTSLLLFFLSSVTGGTGLGSASCCWWLWPLLLLLYKELLNRSLTAFPIVFPLRRLANLPKTTAAVFPALPLALRDWRPLEVSVPVWKLKITLWLWAQYCVYLLEFWGSCTLAQHLKAMLFLYMTQDYNKRSLFHF